MNERGISAVVATVLIILITVAAVTIVWVGVLPMINRLQGINTNVDLQLVASEGYTIWDAENKLASVQVKRGIDESDIIGFDLIFVLSGNSVKHFIDEVPGINSRKVYYINLSNYSGELEWIKLAPVFERGIVGDIVSELKIGKIVARNLQELINSGKIDADDFSEPNGGFSRGSDDDEIIVSSQSEIVRIFSSQTVAQGDQVEVTLDVTILNGETYYAIEEYVPTGWTIIEDSGGATADSNKLAWAVISGAVDTTYTYTVQAPLLMGDYDFDGIYMFEGFSSSIITQGGTTVSVS